MTKTTQQALTAPHGPQTDAQKLERVRQVLIGRYRASRSLREGPAAFETLKPIDKLVLLLTDVMDLEWHDIHGLRPRSGCICATLPQQTPGTDHPMVRVDRRTTGPLEASTEV